LEIYQILIFLTKFVIAIIKSYEYPQATLQLCIGYSVFAVAYWARDRHFFFLSFFFIHSFIHSFFLSLSLSQITYLSFSFCRIEPYVWICSFSDLFEFGVGVGLVFLARAAISADQINFVKGYTNQPHRRQLRYNNVSKPK
jgi:hypothetical protein